MINDMFRLLTSRKADDAEFKVLLKLYNDQHAYFEANSEQAKALLETGEATIDETLPQTPIAALAVVASALLNYDECVMKR